MFYKSRAILFNFNDNFICFNIMDKSGHMNFTTSTNYFDNNKL